MTRDQFIQAHGGYAIQHPGGQPFYLCPDGARFVPHATVEGQLSQWWPPSTDPSVRLTDSKRFWGLRREQAERQLAKIDKAKDADNYHGLMRTIAECNGQISRLDIELQRLHPVQGIGI